MELMTPLASQDASTSATARATFATGPLSIRLNMNACIQTYASLGGPALVGHCEGSRKQQEHTLETAGRALTEPDVSEALPQNVARHKGSSLELCQFCTCSLLYI